MSVTITFELEDSDLTHFREIMARARNATAGMTMERIVAAALEHSRDLRTTALPSYVEERLNGLDEIIAMSLDKDWSLPEDTASHLADALAYFCEPEDLIPDSIPGIGLLDDAIMMELVNRELEPELSAYRDFVKFRDEEYARRHAADDETAVTRADWLDAKRLELHEKARNRRAARSKSGLLASLFSGT